MRCAVQIYMVLGVFHVYKSVFFGWVVGRFYIAVNGEHNCGVLPYNLKISFVRQKQRGRQIYNDIVMLSHC